MASFPRRPNPTPPLVLPPIRDASQNTAERDPTELTTRTPRSYSGRHTPRTNNQISNVNSLRHSASRESQSQQHASHSSSSSPASTARRPLNSDGTENRGKEQTVVYGDLLSDWKPALSIADEIRHASKESKRLREDLQNPRESLGSIEGEIGRQKAALSTEIESLKAITSTQIVQSDKFQATTEELKVRMQQWKEASEVIAKTDEVNQELDRILTNLEAEETNVHSIMKNMDILTKALKDRELSLSSSQPTAKRANTVSNGGEPSEKSKTIEIQTDFTFTNTLEALYTNLTTQLAVTLRTNAKSEQSAQLADIPDYVATFFLKRSGLGVKQSDNKEVQVDPSQLYGLTAVQRQLYFFSSKEAGTQTDISAAMKNWAELFDGPSNATIETDSQDIQRIIDSANVISFYDTEKKRTSFSTRRRRISQTERPEDIHKVSAANAASEQKELAAIEEDFKKRTVAMHPSWASFIHEGAFSSSTNPKKAKSFSRKEFINFVGLSYLEKIQADAMEAAFSNPRLRFPEFILELLLEKYSRATVGRLLLSILQFCRRYTSEPLSRVYAEFCGLTDSIEHPVDVQSFYLDTLKRLMDVNALLQTNEQFLLKADDTVWFVIYPRAVESLRTIFNMFTPAFCENLFSRIEKYTIEGSLLIMEYRSTQNTVRHIKDGSRYINIHDVVSLAMDEYYREIERLQSRIDNAFSSASKPNSTWKLPEFTSVIKTLCSTLTQRQSMALYRIALEANRNGKLEPRLIATSIRFQFMEYIRSIYMPSSRAANSAGTLKQYMSSE